MKNKITIGLLLAAVYLFWLLLSAPARLLALALPEGARLGETTGTLWQGEARQASWRGFDIAHLRWEFGFSSWLPGWHIAFSAPSGLRGQAWLHAKAQASSLRLQANDGDPVAGGFAHNHR